MAFELGAKFKEIQIRKYDKRSRKVVEYTESLEYYVATSKDICKSDRLNILEFLLVRGQLTLKPSGEKNIPAPFVLAERKNPMALRIFLLHPEIHKGKKKSDPKKKIVSKFRSRFENVFSCI